MTSLVDIFVNAATSLLSAIPANQKGHRKEALETVLELGSALQRSIDLAVIYLKGADGLDAQELDVYLREGRGKLRQMSNEFKICGRLYALRDRLNSWWSAAGYAISSDSQALMDILIRGERTVIDTIVSAVPYSLDQSDVVKVRAQIEKAIVELQNQSDEMRKAVRRFVDTM